VKVQAMQNRLRKLNME